MNRIYLDNSTTTQLDPQVLEEMIPLLREGWGSSTQVHTFGRGARKALEEARGRIVQTLGVLPEEITFTCGGTEANNLAILGAARSLG
ncbi:MAG: aminotransferase class V-fold PLP-dependent enzyme, partial [Candidatus Brocadiales bacterium]